MGRAGSWAILMAGAVLVVGCDARPTDRYAVPDTLYGCDPGQDFIAYRMTISGYESGGPIGLQAYVRTVTQSTWRRFRLPVTMTPAEIGIGFDNGDGLEFHGGELWLLQADSHHTNTKYVRDVTPADVAEKKLIMDYLIAHASHGDGLIRSTTVPNP